MVDDAEQVTTRLLRLQWFWAIADVGLARHSDPQADTECTSGTKFAAFQISFHPDLFTCLHRLNERHEASLCPPIFIQMHGLNN